MGNVEHSSLTTTNLHENKGVSTAAANTVATAVAGATVWAKLTADNLTGTGNSFGAQLFHVQDQKAPGTNAGTFTAGAWRTRVLNATLTNQIASASLNGSSQVILPAGTYYIEASAPAILNTAGGHVTKWVNVSDGLDAVIGTAETTTNTSTGVVQTRSFVNGRFGVAGSKAFELQHRTTVTRSSDGLGAAVNVGALEIYADVRIWKIL